MGKKKTWKNIKRAFPLYIMVAPGFLYLLINNYVPMTGIIIAFKHLNFAKGILHSDWAGLSNFKYLFKTPDALFIWQRFLELTRKCMRQLRLTEQQDGIKSNVLPFRC